jgi:hypothetical protein
MQHRSHCQGIGTIESPRVVFFSNSVLTANLSFVRWFPKEHEMARKFTVFKGLAEATLT